MKVSIIFVGIIGLAISLLSYSVDPSLNLENVKISSTSSPTIMQVSAATSLTKMKTETNDKYYETQFKLDKSQFIRAPEIPQATGFVNTDTITLADLKGKVVLVHFWTYTCINCINTVPYLNEWYQKYAGEEFEILGIHTPEFEFEKKLDNVKNAVKDFEIKYPVIQDNNYGIWNAFGNKYWPRDYLIDNEGYIRYNHIGEGGYDQTENMIQSLIQEPDSNFEINSTAKTVA